MRLTTMINAFELPEHNDEEVDMYDVLGLSTPIPSEPMTGQVDTYDPLAAFMDDDDEDEVEMFSFQAPSSMSLASVETLLATLARDLLDDEILNSSLGGGHADLTSLKVQRDRDAYHLSLIVDMGGTQIKPFATVLAVQDAWKPMSAPKGLHARWKPLYDSLCTALTGALAAQGQPSSI